MAVPYITCRQLIDFIIDYVESALDERSSEDFERHLRVCPSCQAYLASYRETMSLAKIVITDEPPTDVPEDLVQAILRRRPSRPPALSRDPGRAARSLIH